MLCNKCQCKQVCKYYIENILTLQRSGVEVSVDECKYFLKSVDKVK